ncbi:TPA: ribosome maturation factor RimP [Candidatus Bipolaricaulota bacterium]|nr:ribosome maturation factor RimP [Candidatus Bipolaricaulota bacterium]
MQREEIIRKVEALVRPLLDYEGLSLVDIEFQRERVGWVLRIYIEKEAGVTLKDCVQVSRELGQLLDVEDFIPYSYHLEVSSPGLDRPLKRREDFERFIGSRIRVRLSEPVQGRKNFRGEIVGCDEEGVSLRVEDKVYKIPFSSVAKANLDPDVKV